MKWIGFVTVAALVAATQADAFRARGGYSVNQVDSNVFEVIPGGPQRSVDYWCAASEYARRELGAGWRQRIYIARGYGPSVTTGRKTAVQFTLNPQAIDGAPAQRSFLHFGFKTGDNMSVQQANGNCFPSPPGF